MNGLITGLAWLLIILTFTGSYRLSNYLAGPSPDTLTASLYPMLIAATITVAFVVVFDFIILLTGLGIISATLLYITDSERFPSSFGLRDRMAKWQNQLLERGQTVYDTFGDQNLAKNSDPDALADDQPADTPHDQ